MKNLFTVDDRNMFSKAVGSFGVSENEWKGVAKELMLAKKNVLTITASKQQGFLSLPNQTSSISEIERLAKDVRKTFTDLVVLGIGGSDLGARAIHQALVQSSLKPRKGIKIHFAGSSTDPDELQRLLNTLNLKRTCVNVVSKSGGTLETMSAFLILRDRLKKAVGKSFAKHVIATTDPKEGALRELATKEGYRTLPIPTNVGGRFSVLTACGLFPIAVMGLDIRSMLRGAKSVSDSFIKQAPSTHPSGRHAAIHVLGMKKRNQRIHVLMPYHASLKEFSKWVRQLVAESLGKQTNDSGKTVFEGATPVAASGPEDQHSQLQLYGEGPFDKLITFIECGRFAGDIKSPVTKGLHEKLDQFGGHSFTKLIHIEREATAESLRQMKRPNATIFIERMSEEHLGALCMHFEIAVAMMAQLLNINAFDQPGVELSKNLMKTALARKT